MSSPVDFIYPLADKGTEWGNNELRYSLRSIAKHLGNVGNIHVVSAVLPRFLRNVEHVKCMDAGNNNAMNTARKLLHGLLASKAKRCVIMNDDFFFAQDCDAAKLPVLSDGTIRESMKRYAKHKGYCRQMQVTLGFLGVPDGRNFALHAPMPVEREKMIEVINESGAVKKVISILNIYGNRHVKDVQMSRNSKLSAKNTEGKDFGKAVGDRHAFSIGDSVIDTRFKAWMAQQYPPSIYES